jgi:GNAT superfamily N-acetyltransferase
LPAGNEAVAESCRAAQRGDLGRIAELARAMHDELRALKGGGVWNAREALPEPLEDSYLGLLDQADARLVVGTLDDAVVGFGAVIVESLRTGERLGVITDLFVQPEARAVGVGESIMGALREFCDMADCIGIDAWALPGHRDAKNFFEENGFSARGIVMHRPTPRETVET